MFFFNDTATTEIYTLSLHDALPIYHAAVPEQVLRRVLVEADEHEQNRERRGGREAARDEPRRPRHRGEQLEQQQERHVEEGERSEEHTSELQSRQYLVCRLLLEKKK